MPDGFLVVDKPVGLTSHDIVARVRRCFKIKGVGHTGTLDPFATGVLPVALGAGTKAIQFLDESTKVYRAVMRLGVATDSLDCTGTVLSEADCSAVTRQLLDSVIARFTGDISQIPPMYSAIKQGGVPLYKLARKGETVERSSRPVRIESITIDDFSLPDVTITVRCSKGTYIRTLADDIGRELGCGAHLVQLRRLASGSFIIEGAVTVDELASEGACAALQSRIISVSSAIGHLRKLPLDDLAFGKVRDGVALLPADLGEAAAMIEPGETVQLLHGGELAAVARADDGWGSGGGKVRVVRGFCQDYPLHTAG